MKIRLSTEEDLKEIIQWFPTLIEARKWGGPSVKFPINLIQLKIDLDWESGGSYCLVDENDKLIGFCHVYDRFGFKHLSRIAISPAMRGLGHSYKLMHMIQKEVFEPGTKLSLYVYENNTPAKRLYVNLGFCVSAYPENTDEIKECIFMVKEI